MALDYSLLKYDYTDEYICVKTLNLPNNDQFEYSYDPETKILNISRKEPRAWGYNLKIFIFNKQNKKHKLFEFGSVGSWGDPKFLWYIKHPDSGKNYKLEVNFDDFNSSLSCLVKTENFLNSADLISQLNNSSIKNYLALTMTPADFNHKRHFGNIESLLLSQSCLFEKIFITVCEEYKDFNQLVNPGLLKLFRQYPNVDIIYTKDYNKATAYMGPLLHRSEEICNNRVILINANVSYDSNFLRNFLLAFETYEDHKFVIGKSSPLDPKIDKSDEIEFKIKKGSIEDAQVYGYGHLYLDGFAGAGFRLNENEINLFRDYNLKIFENIPDSFWYSPSISKTYLNFLEEEVVYMTHGGIDFNATCILNQGKSEDLTKSIKRNYIIPLMEMEEIIYNYTLNNNLLQ